MRVLLFGATGMVGQGVLRACLADSGVSQVVAAGRSPTGQTHPKLVELTRADLKALVDEDLQGFDLCCFCVGVSSAGLAEAAYRALTVDLAVSVATMLRRASPEATLRFVSGAGTDVKSKTMWARVKGEAEEALKQMGFRQLFLFRPGFIQPMDGIVSKTGSYRILYAVLSPFYFILRHLPRYVTSTRAVGQAMLRVHRQGFARQTLESIDINAVSQ